MLLKDNFNSSNLDHFVNRIKLDQIAFVIIESFLEKDSNPNELTKKIILKNDEKRIRYHFIENDSNIYLSKKMIIALNLKNQKNLKKGNFYEDWIKIKLMNLKNHELGEIFCFGIFEGINNIASIGDFTLESIDNIKINKEKLN